MDYNATDIAVSYDRGRDHGPEFLDLWMNVVSSHVKDQRTKTILDLHKTKGESRNSRLFYFYLFTFALLTLAPGCHP
jgi:hypothetical protein